MNALLTTFVDSILWCRNDELAVSKPKSKKKPKKAKFKSLKKAALASESKAVKEDLPNEHLSIDDEATSYDTTSSEMVSRHLTLKKKRKEALDGDEENSSRKSKKVKKARPELCAVDLESDLPSEQLDEPKYSKLCGSVDLEQKPIGRSKMAGKVSITAMPVKRVLTIKPEKLKKKGNIWSRDCLPLPDFWMPEEDAMLCALVHEYGPHWSLVSETLYGMVAGGLYRGRYRHSVHCCERFRELIQRHVLSAADNPNNEKAGNTCSGKALLKVTEVKLDVVFNLPPNVGKQKKIQDREYGMSYKPLFLSNKHSDNCLCVMGLKWFFVSCKCNQKSLLTRDFKLLSLSHVFWVLRHISTASLYV